MKTVLLSFLIFFVSCSSSKKENKDQVTLTDKGKQIKTTEDLHVLVGCKMNEQIEVTFDNPEDGVVLLRNVAGEKGGHYLANPEFGENPEAGKKYAAKADLYRCRQ
jgi:hypothetical protein